MLTQNIKSITKDRFKTVLVIFWLLSVVSSFSGSALLSFTFPAIGELFPFRILLPITAVLWLIYAIKTKEHLLKNRSLIEKLCYLTIVILLIVGAVSMFRAIDTSFTFRRYFNLCYVLCLFFMTFRMCSDKRVRELTVQICFVCLSVLCILGLYEVFFGGIFNLRYDDYRRFEFFNHVFQAPAVFSENTNDYNSVIIFVYGILLLEWIKPGQKVELYKYISLAVLGMAVYFLISAGASRLCLIAFVVLFAAIIVKLFSANKNFMIVPLAIVVSMIFTMFAENYRDIKPAIQDFINNINSHTDEAPTTTDEAPTDAQDEPTTGSSVIDEFIAVDSSTGEITINGVASGGIRIKLLIHTFDCFRESYGLGVGLGNTEQLAKSREVIENAHIYSIHCFIARMIADFGIFFLIPFMAIILLMLKHLFDCFLSAIRKKDKNMLCNSLYTLLILLTYPIISTSSSDSQNIASMWLFLAFVVFACEVQNKSVSENHSQLPEQTI